MECTKAQERMLASRSTWESWVKRGASSPKYENTPAFKAHEIIAIGDSFPHTRFEFQAARYNRLAHVGAFDTLKKRWVVLRKTAMTYEYSSVSNALWEVEFQRNKSNAYNRYRGLNDCWKQDRAKVQEYRVAVVDDQEFPDIKLKHIDNDDRIENARVGMIVTINSYQSGGRLFRISGISPTGDQLIVKETFGVNKRAHSPETIMMYPKHIQVGTLASCMEWLMQLKLVMNDVCV